LVLHKALNADRHRRLQSVVWTHMLYAKWKCN